ncbi:MAG: hypothetical protein ABI599_01540 [Flavobacteriales bacterium]
MTRTFSMLMSSAACTLLAAQPPVPPPVGTNLNSGVPSDWTISTLSSTGWLWSGQAGFNGSGGLIMDCGSCSSYQESTLWSPWLDLSNDPQVAVVFKCAIIGGGMMVPPPIFVQRDGIGGPSYEYRYGFAGLIPAPDEVIPSTINPFPPLDPGNVQWVDILYTFYAGLNDDSVRIGFGTGVPLGGWALLDEISIGGFPLGVATHQHAAPTVTRDNDILTVRSADPIQRIDLLDALGRTVMDVNGRGERDLELPIRDFRSAVYVLRIQCDGAQTAIKVGL